MISLIKFIETILIELFLLLTILIYFSKLFSYKQIDKLLSVKNNGSAQYYYA